MDGPEYKKDPEYSGEPPTLSGYQDYSARIEKDPFLWRETHEAFRAHIFQPKPAIVHYDDLHKSEKQLEQLSKGHFHGNGNLQEFWCMERTEIPILDHCKTNEERLEAVQFVRNHYENWNERRKMINQDRSAEQETKRRDATERRKGDRDVAAFWARREVNSHYSVEHEDNNEFLKCQLETYGQKEREQNTARQAAQMREQLQKTQEPRRRWGFRRDPDIEVDR
jgi:hypothetical protein